MHGLCYCLEILWRIPKVSRVAKHHNHRSSFLLYATQARDPTATWAKLKLHLQFEDQGKDSSAGCQRAKLVQRTPNRLGTKEGSNASTLVADTCR